MKLVELLARELREWPGHASYAEQDHDCEVRFGPGSTKADFFAKELADEDVGFSCADGITWAGQVTRADWEAEKARIAGNETWLRHRGRKCPVQSGALVDLKLRGGVIHRGKFCDNHAWIHTGKPFDVMYWRLSEPAWQTAPASEGAIQVGIDAADAGKLTPIAEVKSRFVGKADGPLFWRDRIRTLDTQRAELEATYQRQIGEIDVERVEMVRRLAEEGFALVEVAVRPVEDMSDWRNWRLGDLAEVVSTSGFTKEKLSVGDVVPIIDIDEQDGMVRAAASCWGDVGVNYKWNSRPAS